MTEHINQEKMPFSTFMRCTLIAFCVNLLPAACCYSAPVSVRNTSYVSDQGERVLRIETDLSESISTSWKAFTTETLAKRWLAPVIHIDLKVGGTVKTRYDYDGKLGDDGTIVLGIVNYLDRRLITYKVNLNDAFPAHLHSEDGNLQEIVEFVSLGPKRTRVVSSMIGWGTGADWDKAYEFFAKGNKWTYEQLVKVFSKESN